jgi:hypothetical protein
MPELGKKLQLKSSDSIFVLNAPEAFTTTLKAEGYTITSALAPPAVGAYDAIHLFIRSKNDLKEFASQALTLLKPNGQLWIAYPKKSSELKSDVSRDKGWKALTELGYAGVRLVAVDKSWSTLRFRHVLERNKESKFGVDLPGIDRHTKTVTPPDDLRIAIEQEGLLEIFNSLSFTKRKEIMTAVLEAKRTETRVKRIQKTLEQVKN